MISRKHVVVPESSARYVDTVNEDDLLQALWKNTKQFRKLLRQIPKKKINYAYAEGKWTLKEMLQHIVDAERVFVYRALSFARKDPSPLPGFDENTWAITAKAPKRKWNDLVDEFIAMRTANQFFFESLDEDQLLTTGTANNSISNVVGLGFVTVGHLNHHMRIIRERYLNDYVLEGQEKKEKEQKDMKNGQAVIKETKEKKVVKEKKAKGKEKKKKKEEKKIAKHQATTTRKRKAGAKGKKAPVASN